MPAQDAAPGTAWRAEPAGRPRRAPRRGRRARSRPLRPCAAGRGRGRRAPPPGAGPGAGAPASAGSRRARRTPPPRGGPAPCRNRRGSRPARLRDCRRTAPGSGRGRALRPSTGGVRAPAPSPFRRALPRASAGAVRAGAPTCIVKVDAPDTTCPLSASCADARSTASGSTPGCHAKARDPRRRPACGDRAGRPCRARPAAAICRRRSETRAGSTRPRRGREPTRHARDRATAAVG